MSYTSSLEAKCIRLYEIIQANPEESQKRNRLETKLNIFSSFFKKHQSFDRKEPLLDREISRRGLNVQFDHKVTELYEKAEKEENETFMEAIRYNARRLIIEAKEHALRA